MDCTQCMVHLLQKLRKQMNGAMLDTFVLYGKKYGVCYGVSIPELKHIARELAPSDELFRFLFRQQVRELKIISLFVAEKEKITADDATFLSQGIINSEMAELSAKYLLCSLDCLDEIVRRVMGEDEMLSYALLMALSYRKRCTLEQCAHSLERCLEKFPDSRLIAMSSVTLLDEMKKENRALVESMLCRMTPSKTSSLVREEMEWRLNY